MSCVKVLVVCQTCLKSKQPKHCPAHALVDKQGEKRTHHTADCAGLLGTVSGSILSKHALVPAKVRFCPRPSPSLAIVGVLHVSATTINSYLP